MLSGAVRWTGALRGKSRHGPSIWRWFRGTKFADRAQHVGELACLSALHRVDEVDQREPAAAAEQNPFAVESLRHQSCTPIAGL